MPLEAWAKTVGLDRVNMQPRPDARSVPGPTRLPSYFYIQSSCDLLHSNLIVLPAEGTSRTDAHGPDARGYSQGSCQRQL